MRWLCLAVALLLAWPAYADMYQDASNAKLPEALGHLGIQVPAACDGFVAADGAVTGAAFTSASAAFTAQDAGKKISIRKAGARFFAADLTPISAGGAGHTVGDLVSFADGISVFVRSVSGGAVTGVYAVSLGSSATNPATIAQTGSVKSGSTLASPVAGGTGLVLAPVWVRENLVTTIASVGGPTTATLGLAAGVPVSDQYWGYGTDYSAEIAAVLAQGKAVRLPRGICGQGTTLSLSSGDVVVGRGRGTETVRGSVLLWLGPPGQPQVSLDAAGARVNTVQTGNYDLEGLGSASKGWYMRATSSGMFYDTGMNGHTTVGLDIHGSATTTSIKNQFERLDVAESDGSAGDLHTHGVWWGHPNTYATMNDHALSYYGPIQTKTASGNGVGLLCGASDHNTAVYIQTRTSGTVPGVDMLGSNWAQLGHCRNNQFYGMDAGAGGLHVRATGWLHPAENIVNFYDRDNGGPVQSIEPGGLLDIRDSNSRWDGLKLLQRGVTNLPTGLDGTMHYAININTRTPGAIPGLGSHRAPVFFDGTDWRVTASLRPRAVMSPSQASPTGTTSTTHVMMGLGSAAAMTPAVSGNVSVTLWGMVANSAAAGNTRVRLLYGTGTAPANGAALTGTSACSGTPQINYTSATAGASGPFSLTCVVTGLTLDTADWFDAAVAGSAANTSTISTVTIQAAEQ